MAVGSTQPLTEMSRRNIFLGSKGGCCIGLVALPPSCAYCLETWEPKPLGTLRACPGTYRDCFTFNLWAGQLLNELSEFYQIRVLDRCNGTSHVPGSLLSIMTKSSRPFLEYAFNLIYISQNF